MCAGRKNLIIVFILFFLFYSDYVFARLVINEVLYDSPGVDTGCFVELTGQPGMNLDEYYLLGINGGSGKEYNRIELAGYEIPHDGYFVVAQDNSVENADVVNPKVNFQNGPDNILLYMGNEIADAVGYGDFVDNNFAGEGEPTLDISGYSIGRRPDGLDTDNNQMDFVVFSVITPGRPNTPAFLIERSKYTFTVWSAIR
ncbi:hypothetical protein GF312_21310 [Candidatus Poribacteria bacterium]|nr:hypothetical protein [Candidatus Poribacteria bacterium]